LPKALPMTLPMTLPEPAPAASASAACVRAGALAALRIGDPVAKVSAVRALFDSLRAGQARIDAERRFEAPGDIPGRPAQPALVAPRCLARRSMQSAAGRTVLLHALAHIEFNAINLALDAMWRFAGMPAPFYCDWLEVAEQEAYHFSLLSARLVELDSGYGAFPAHDGLWEMAEKTRGDALARMALVPRTLEARGLDAAPPMRAALARAGDEASAAILDIILRDEIGHVLIGNRWYRWLCAQAGVDPVQTYPRLVDEYRAPRLKGPFNLAARRAAGFDDAELEALQAAYGAALDAPR
jgi:uncharacterized ferritin-like protein (DUF455 family)